MLSKEWRLAGCRLPTYPWEAPEHGFGYIWIELPECGESGRRKRVDYKVEPDRLVKST